MLIKFCNWFTKITAWPVQKLLFRTKIHYEDQTVQGRKIKGSAILISNHTSVFDYAAHLFVFFTRTLRFQMAEVLFQKRILGCFLRCMGGIRVDRDAFNFGFMTKSQDILDRGGVVGIFPEGRIPLPDEARPLPFKPSAAFLALSSGAKIIPIFTNGSYFSKKRAQLIIGTPFYAADFTDASLTDKENIDRVNTALRQRITELETILNERCTKTKE